MECQNQPLFMPYRMGDLDLPNRIVMAPMTRSKSPGQVPNDEVAAYSKAEEATPTLQLAEAVDHHWPEVSSAFRSLKAPKGEFPSILTFTGFYTSVYRKASTLVHADMASPDRFLTMPLVHHATVHPREKHAHSRDHPTISVAFVGFQLIVLGIKFGWPKEELTRSITDHLYYRDADEDSD